MFIKTKKNLNNSGQRKTNQVNRKKENMKQI